MHKRNIRQQNIQKARAKHANPAQPQTKVADEVPVLASGRPAVLLATGPSLCEEDIEYLRPLHEKGAIHVLGLGDAYRICDFLDVFYFCDPKWLELNPSAAKYGSGQTWTQCAKSVAKHSHMKRIAGSGGNGLCKSPHHIFYNGNSGFQLINLAWHMGFGRSDTPMYLLGYNMGATDNKRKKQHFFGHHPAGLNQSNSYKSFVGGFMKIAKEDRANIINCTEPSFLSPDVFEFVPLREALPHNEKVRHVQARRIDVAEARSRQAAAIFKTDPEVRRPEQHEGNDGSDHRDGDVVVGRTTTTHKRATYGGTR